MNTTITFYGEKIPLTFEVTTYQSGGRTCILAHSPEELFGRITVNVPGYPLEPGEMLVKTWSENEWVTQLLTLLPDVFQDTGKRCDTGFVQAQIWRYTREN